MNHLANELQRIIESAAEPLLAIPDAQARAAPQADSWSPKQIIGHLIDSAANNHARFVRAQYSDDLIFAGYNQAQWVAAQRYDDEAWPALVQLWKSYNLHLAHIIAHIPDATLTQVRTRHTLDAIAWQPVSADEPATLEYLVNDYMGHLKDHLTPVFDQAQT
jgi:hypothetical protein